jgi:hypothetical protein
MHLVAVFSIDRFSILTRRFGTVLFLFLGRVVFRIVLRRIVHRIHNLVLYIHVEFLTEGKKRETAGSLGRELFTVIIARVSRAILSSVPCARGRAHRRGANAP